MKKAILFVTMVFFVMIMAGVVFAKETDQQYSNTEYKFESAHNRAQKNAEQYNKFYGNDLVWAIFSMDNHQRVADRYFTKWEYEDFEKVYNKVDIDFVQVGSLFTATNTGEVEYVKKLFEDDPINSAVNFIVPIDMEDKAQELFERIVERQFPIYWRVEPTKTDETRYVVEVAIGKYQINKGDTLSQIAQDYNRTVDEILKWNKNIINPDKIFAGDYLVIK